MRSDIDIKDEIYAYLKDTALVKTLSGSLNKTLRPEDSNKEDIVISILANQNAEIQECYININIYVSDIRRGRQYIENSARLRELCKLSVDCLGRIIGNDYRAVLDSQRVMEVNGKHEHFINNKLFYQHCKY